MTKTVVKTVADVATLQAVAPQLKVATPVIPTGHPNEAQMAAALNVAQSAPTSAMQNEAVATANFLSATLSWRP